MTIQKAKKMSKMMKKIGDIPTYETPEIIKYRYLKGDKEPLQKKRDELRKSLSIDSKKP